MKMFRYIQRLPVRNVNSSVKRFITSEEAYNISSKHGIWEEKTPHPVGSEHARAKIDDKIMYKALQCSHYLRVPIEQFNLSLEERLKLQRGLIDDGFNVLYFSSSNKSETRLDVDWKPDNGKWKSTTCILGGLMLLSLTFVGTLSFVFIHTTRELD